MAAKKVDILDNADAQTLKEWVRDVADVVGAEVLVSDDADAFKTAADENGMEQQVCKPHVLRNTEECVEKMKPQLARDADGSLGMIGVSPEQALADCDELLRLMRERQPEPKAGGLLEAIHRRYVAAAPPKRDGEERAGMTLAYRLRLFTLDRWNLWPRLTLYRSWRDKDGGCLDGTNNATERAIGWWVKRAGERRRSTKPGTKRCIT